MLEQNYKDENIINENNSRWYKVKILKVTFVLKLMVLNVVGVDERQQTLCRNNGTS